MHEESHVASCAARPPVRCSPEVTTSENCGNVVSVFSVTVVPGADPGANCNVTVGAFGVVDVLNVNVPPAGGTTWAAQPPAGAATGVVSPAPPPQPATMVARTARKAAA